MTKLRTYKPEALDQARWVEDVGRALTAQLGGLSWADNVGPVLTFRYLAAKAPISVRMPSRVPPVSLSILRILNLTDSTFESGCRVKWTLDREHVVIHAIDVVDTNDEYDVTLGLLMG